MKIKDILACLEGLAEIRGKYPEDLNIQGLAYDSRIVKPGDLFVAIKGAQADGHKFVPQALERGAAAILCEYYLEEIPPHIPQLISPNSRALMSKLAAAFSGWPDRDFFLVGITGTNGKTTTTHLLKWLWECAGFPSGIIGTIKNYIGKKELATNHTTPESLEIFELFSEMREAKIKNAAMEVSSHSLKQGRVAGCSFNAGVFTNLTQDHLDFHNTLEDYKKSKAVLFEMLENREGENNFALINKDDEAGEYMAARCRVPVYYYGLGEGCHLRVKEYRSTPLGTVFTLLFEGREYPVKIPLIGRFNIYNALAALGVALGQGLPLKDCIGYLKNAPQIAGRFELINAGQDFTVIVDYAHTPDGLLNLLTSAGEIAAKRIITVFGCGGDRDRTKRPIMADIAAKYSDFVIITSDNPRSENPFEILDQIEEGIKGKNCPYLKIESRLRAIEKAVKMAEKGDMLIIAGKGHEDYQLVGQEVLHFDDRETARELIKELLAGR